MSEEIYISVMIVNYNGSSIIDECLASVVEAKAKSSLSIEIIVIDNASTDDSINVIQKYSEVILVKADKNEGYSGGLNFGLQYCRGKYIYMMNNDITVSDDTFVEVVKYFESHSDVGIIGSMTLNKYSPGHIDIAGSDFAINGFLTHIGIDDLASDYTTPLEFFGVKGTGYAIPRKLVDEIGYLIDPRYFAYLEETDLCWRVLLLNKKVVFLPQSKIVHLGAHTHKRFNFEFIEFHSFKNRTCNILKNTNGLELLIVLPLHLLTLLVLIVVFALQRNGQMMRAISRSIWWNILNLPTTYKYRKLTLSKRKLSYFGMLPYFKLPNIGKNIKFLLLYMNYRSVRKNAKNA